MKATVGLGSNLGDRLANLQFAIDSLNATVGTQVHSISPVYETDPVGGPAQFQHRFYARPGCRIVHSPFCGGE